MSGERRNNRADMTITEQFESIKQRICDKYCKYPQIVHEQWLKEEIEDRDEYLYKTHCESCPLNEL